MAKTRVMFRDACLFDVPEVRTAVHVIFLSMYIHICTLKKHLCAQTDTPNYTQGTFTTCHPCPHNVSACHSVCLAPWECSTCQGSALLQCGSSGTELLWRCLADHSRHDMCFSRWNWCVLSLSSIMYTPQQSCLFA